MLSPRRNLTDASSFLGPVKAICLMAIVSAISVPQARLNVLKLLGPLRDYGMCACTKLFVARSKKFVGEPFRTIAKRLRIFAGQAADKRLCKIMRRIADAILSNAANDQVPTLH